jgi:hypothetical protein
MPSDVTRRMLDQFAGAVIALEDAIDHRAAVLEIGRLDADLAIQMRETFAHVERLRSRPIA